MLGATVILAVGVAAALGDAFGAPFCADVVGDRLGVFGGVGGDVVGADAGVVESVRVTVVLGGKSVCCLNDYEDLDKYIPRWCRTSWREFGDRSEGRHSAGWCTRCL